MRSNGFFRVLSICSVIACVVPFAGCSTTAGSSKQVEVKAVTVEQQVAKRAQARWDALLARDIKSAYGFISPAGRLTLPFEIYSGRIDPTIWKKAVFKSAECEKELCKVQITLDFILGSIPVTHILNEQWILSEGEWWFVYTPLTG